MQTRVDEVPLSGCRNAGTDEIGIQVGTDYPSLSDFRRPVQKDRTSLSPGAIVTVARGLAVAQLCGF